MNKAILIIIILAIIIVGLAAILFWPKSKAPQNQPNPQPQADIQVDAPTEGQLVTSPLTISGIVRGNGWTGFEGQVGGVTLKDSLGNTLAQGPLTATTDWMVLPTNFSTSLTFNAGSATTGQLIFHNENASGDPAKDKTFTVNVKFQ